MAITWHNTIHLAGESIAVQLLHRFEALWAGVHALLGLCDHAGQADWGWRGGLADGESDRQAGDSLAFPLPSQPPPLSPS